jgi:hypothetical protein
MVWVYMTSITINMIYVIMLHCLNLNKLFIV